MKVVTAVRVDGKTGMVGSVKWGEWNHQSEAWASPAIEAPVDQVVAALDHGDKVWALFTAGGVDKAIGPELRRIADGAGNESVDIVGASPGQAESITFTVRMDKF